MKDLDAKGVAPDLRNNREPLSNFKQGHDRKEEGKTRERRSVRGILQ